jgi:hypothetical protein
MQEGQRNNKCTDNQSCLHLLADELSNNHFSIKIKNNYPNPVLLIQTLIHHIHFDIVT